MLRHSSPQSWLISNGRLIDPTQNLDRIGRLLLRDGRIAAIDPSDGDLPSDVNHVDASQRIVAPGLIDLGAELGEPGREEDESIATGTLAALAGGYTAITCTSNSVPPIDTAAGVEFVRQKAARADRCRVYVTGCVSKQREGQELAEIGSLVDAGAIALGDAPRPIDNTALLRRALEYCLMFDRPLFDQPEISSLTRGGVMHEGRLQLILGLTPLPPEAEDLATARDLRLVETTQGRLHLTSISTIGSVELIRRAKSRGIVVTAGIRPANLCLNDTLLRSFDPNCKVNPPLRSEDHISACIAALADGTIDLITSGHQPRALEKKMQELDAAPFGMTTLELTLSMVITYLVRPGHLTWLQAIEKLSSAPAKVISVEGGSLKIGQPADVTIIDPDRSWTVNARELHSHSNNTPLDGRELFGRATEVWVDGIHKYSLQT